MKFPKWAKQLQILNQDALRLHFGIDNSAQIQLRWKIHQEFLRESRNEFNARKIFSIKGENENEKIEKKWNPFKRVFVLEIKEFVEGFEVCLSVCLSFFLSVSL